MIDFYCEIMILGDIPDTLLKKGSCLVSQLPLVSSVIERLGLPRHSVLINQQERYLALRLLLCFQLQRFSLRRTVHHGLQQ